MNTDNTASIMPQTLADDLWRVKEAYRFFLDGSDEQLRAFGISRAEALTKARELDRALPKDIRTETGAWAQEAFATSTLAPMSGLAATGGSGPPEIIDIVRMVPKMAGITAGCRLVLAIIASDVWMRLPSAPTAAWADMAFGVFVLGFGVYFAQSFVKYLAAIIYYLMSSAKKS